MQEGCLNLGEVLGFRRGAWIYIGEVLGFRRGAWKAFRSWGGRACTFSRLFFFSACLSSSCSKKVLVLLEEVLAFVEEVLGSRRGAWI